MSHSPGSSGRKVEAPGRCLAQGLDSVSRSLVLVLVLDGLLGGEFFHDHPRDGHPFTG
jgi:hypothetical protein